MDTLINKELINIIAIKNLYNLIDCSLKINNLMEIFSQS
jgi:hypothetical protein